MKLIYTEDAIKDLKRLREFIAKHNPNAALRVAQELISKINLLVDFPNLGTPVKLAPSPETVRDMIFGNYIVRYSIHKETIIVLRIWHGLEGERK
ncbi:MAG: type II toxin-antitoxin system RelE/ParE family toxin [Marinomonas sp.]|uniref:type II toxin-antitoxin system RelE/ParE family toxin n=1 Tax=Marinomonas sp. TaxID=1904862 RepID=UPI003F9C19B1